MANQEFFVNIDLKGNEIKNVRVENATTLGTGKAGQVKFLTQKDGSNDPGYYYNDGSNWIKVTTKSETDAIKSDIADIKDAIGSGAGESGSLLDRVGTLEASVAANTGNISTNTSNISGLTTRMTAVEGVANAAKTTAESNTAAIGDEATPTSILGRIKIAEGDIDTLQSDMTTAKGDITTAKSDISTLKTTVGSASSGLVKDVADNTSAINTLKTTVGDASSGLVKTVNDLDAAYKAADTTLGNRITTIEGAYLPKTEAASTYRTIADSYTKTEVDNAVKTAISSAYKVKGSKTASELAALGAADKVEGYVYNITEPFTIGTTQYPAGTNVVWVGDAATGSWDALAGFTDLSAYAKTADVTSAIATAKSEAITAAGTATDTKLQGYVPTSRTVNGHALTGNVTVTATDVGLGNVDNTSDANKPVSTAQQAALDKKADLVATGAGTWTGKITVNAQGIVTAGANLTAADVPTITSSKISDFASAVVTAGKAVFTGVNMTVSESWQNVGETVIGAYPSAITAYNSSGEVIGVALKYDSTNKKVQYMVNEAVTATVVVSL